MKTLLTNGVLLFLSFCVRFISTEPLVVKCGYPEDSLEEFIESRNKARMELAIRKNISNMHEFVGYNADFDKVGEKFKSCDDIKHGSNYRVNDFDDWESVQAVMKIFDLKELVHDREMFHPLQTTFAFCELTPYCHKSGPANKTKYFSGQGREMQNFFMYGPHTTFSASDFKYGPPGSDCPNGKAKSGLCKGPEVKKTISNEEAASGESSKASALSYSSLFYLPIVLMILLA